MKEQCGEMGKLIQAEYLNENYLDSLDITNMMSIILIILLFIGLPDVNHIIENLELALYSLDSRSFMILLEKEDDDDVILISNIENFMYVYKCENNNECSLIKKESGIVVDEGIYSLFICL